MADPEDVVDDDEVVYRLIQPYPSWFEPPDTINSSSFKLEKKKNEIGLSVFRASMATPDDVRSFCKADDSYHVAGALVRDIRNAVKGDGKALNLDVVRVDVEPPLPGHSEIRGDITGAASRKLAKIFKIVDSNL